VTISNRISTSTGNFKMPVQSVSEGENKGVAYIFKDNGWGDNRMWINVFCKRERDRDHPYI
jgi:hypothetical protein